MSAHRPNQPPHRPEQESAHGFSLTAGEILAQFRHHGMFAFAFALTAAAAVAFYLFQKPAVYRAEARIILETNPDRVLNIEQVVDNSVNRQYLPIEQNNNVEEMRGAAFHRQVVETMPPDLARKVVAPYANEENLDPNLQSIFSAHFSAKAVYDTHFFVFSYLHPDPEVAARVVNFAARQYRLHQMDRSQQGMDAAIEFLRKQTKSWRQRVEDADAALQRYRQENNLVSHDDDENFATSKLAALTDSLTQIEIQLDAANTRVEQVNEREGDVQALLEVPEVANFGQIPELRRRLAENASERKLLAQEYLGRHPLMTENTATAENLRHELNAAIADAVGELKTQQEQLLRQRDRIKSQVDKAEEEALALDEKAIQYKVLARDLDTNKEIYTEVLNRLNETEIAQRLNQSNLRLAEPARPPGTPFEPNPLKSLLTAGFVFCVLFGTTPLALGLVDRRLRTAREIEQCLGTELLGAIPRQRGSRRRPVERSVLDYHHPVLTEAFRGIFTNFLLRSRGNRGCGLVISSSVPGEGKSFVTSNLAACFASHGLRTLIIDLDLRRPRIDEIFDQDQTEKGLLKWFRSGRPISSRLRDDPDLGIHLQSEKLEVLCSGGTTRHASETIQSDRFRRLVERAKQEYDYVLLDTPPAGIFSDAILAAEHVEYALFIVRHLHTRRAIAQEAFEHLAKTSASTVGVIYNLVRGGLREAGGYRQANASKYRKYYRPKSTDAHREEEILRHVD